MQSRSITQLAQGIMLLPVALLIVSCGALKDSTRAVIVHHETSTQITLSENKTGFRPHCERCVIMKAKEHCRKYGKKAILRTKMDMRTYTYSCED